MRATRPQELTTTAERLSFLYAEKCRVHRDANAITLTDERGVVHVPAASIAVLLLGPGTTITQQAITVLADSGASAVWTGSDGARFYAAGAGTARSSRLLVEQARKTSNRLLRLEVARRMYAMRFPGEDTSRLTMQQLRGREGARVRAAYRREAERTGVLWGGRKYDASNWSAGDIVNRALSASNSALYGLIHSVVVALGCSPGLGFIHTGHALAFVHDIADLYKAEITVPAAFEVARKPDGDIGRAVRLEVRKRIVEFRLLERAVRDLIDLLTSERVDEDAVQLDIGSHLWDEQIGAVAGGVAYGTEEW